LPPTTEDLIDRRPVWEALSDMYLDTDVALSRAWRAQMLAESKYSLDELEEILVHEVHPVCWPNLLSVAGVWDGFDQAWLEQRILGRLGSPSLFARLFGRRRRVSSSIAPEWAETRLLVAAIREKCRGAAAG
jgi:hypothetical protein